ncbi:Histone chaperone domain CHZ [Fusarium oxysporum f. sp. vasinfectum]|nr:Histone chaperone domain CHZ [Fusarium oxysporum f. sp. vasinfectum]WKT38647.1 Histone chaperone domain CHZ [Fusarium oxysporum f. sp. vasinfectum]
MADNNATLPQDPSQAQGATFAEEKGKGKAPAEQMTEDTVPEADEEDGLEEIDPSNIVEGRRTRGAQIDFAKAAEQHPADDEDEEDDEDFQPPNEDTKMSD